MDEKPRKARTVLWTALALLGPISVRELHRRKQEEKGLVRLDAGLRLLLFRCCVHFNFAVLFVALIVFPFCVLDAWLTDFDSRPLEAVGSVGVAVVFGVIIGAVAIWTRRELLKTLAPPPATQL